MNTQEDFEQLISPYGQGLINTYLHVSPVEIALKHKFNEMAASLIATQVKYLQKSKKKLPHFYQHRCIIPPLSFEQSSSETTASLKQYSGTQMLDLTFGLGVDSYCLSAGFERIIALEKQILLAQIGRYNMTKLGKNHIEILPTSAEEFLSEYDGSSFDLLYIDPSRRSQKNKKVFLLEDCSPNVLTLMPLMKRVSKLIVIKLSPLFDLTEVIRKIPNTRKILVISVRNECKEVLVEVDPHHTSSTIMLEIVALIKGQLHRFEDKLERDPLPIKHYEPKVGEYIYDADVGFYKGRMLNPLFHSYFQEGKGGFISAEEGFWGTKHYVETAFPGRIFQVEAIFPYKPKQIKRYLKGMKIKHINIIKRHFPHSTQLIHKQLQLSSGGEYFLLCTRTFSKDNKVFLVKRLI